MLRDPLPYSAMYVNKPNMINRKISLNFKEKIYLTLGLVIVYFFGAHLGLSFSSDNQLASPFWLPSGIGIAAVVIFGFRDSISGIMLGICILMLGKTYPVISMLGFIFSNIIEASVGGFLLKKLGKGDYNFSSSKDVLRFLFFSVLFPPIIGCTFIASGLYLGGLISFNSVPAVWISFMMGNALGILVITPLALKIFERRRIKDLNALKVFEILTLVASLFLISNLAVHGQKNFLVYPFIIWAALRFSFMGVSCSTLIISAVAFWHSVNGKVVFEGGSAEVDMLWIQAFAGICCVGGYLLSMTKQSENAVVEIEEESNRNLLHKKNAEVSLELVDQTIQNSPIGFALIDRNFKYLKINQVMADLNGFSIENHLGKTLDEMMPGIAHHINDMITHIFKTGESILSIPIKTGLNKFPFTETSGLLSYYPIRQKGISEIFAVAVSFEDLTVQYNVEAKLRENQTRLNVAQEAGKMGIFDWCFLSNEIHWTPELEAIYGYEKNTFDGRYATWARHIHPDDFTRLKNALETSINENFNFGIQFRIIRKDSSIRWILARGGTRKDSSGKHIGFSGINIDITEQKKIEERLRKAEGELLNALDARDEFFAIASHELKTPLTSLKLQIQLYQRSLMKAEPHILSQEKIADLLAKNASQVDRISRLVDDMLDISRIRTGKLSLKMERCEIGQIVYDILVRYKEQFITSGSGGPVILTQDEAFGNWDTMRIEQVISNVINNAIRYGLGKPISIAIVKFEDSVRISVADQGMGIAPEEQKRIFQRFERGATREVSGLGLGLFICEQIISAHGGSIWVESKIGEGSTFHIELPTIAQYAETLTAVSAIG